MPQPLSPRSLQDCSAMRAAAADLEFEAAARLRAEGALPPPRKKSRRR